MNDPISWDPSLVKKFSSSNHFKLLNQLRNEVIKYPLNNKKKPSSIKNNENNHDNRSKLIDTHTHNSPLSNKTNQNKESNNNKTSVSFNNAKNFSIYNSSKSVASQNESLLSDQ